jgi:hypothetical protein
VPDGTPSLLEEFERMPLSKRIRICRMAAARARKSAELSNARQRKLYLKVAKQWDKLADLLEQQRGGFKSL